VLAALGDLIDSGVLVTCLGGNHDWWIGSHLTTEYGIAVHHGPLWLDAQGKRLYIEHGDGKSQASRVYDLVRAVLHHPAATKAFSLLHPNIAGKLANHIASRSRQLSGDIDPEQQLIPVYQKIRNEVFSQGADIAVFGHVHMARIESSGEGTVILLGDWIHLGTYSELTDGVMSLCTWDEPV